MRDPRSGTLLAGRYRVGELLGEGGMGAVYAATDEQLGRPVAVKVLLTEGATGAESRAERFRREARVAARLAHPHIVSVSDFGTDEATGSAFLVMEKLEGRSLREIVRAEKTLAPARVVAILAQTLDALAAAHDTGIVHRDLTPANLFVARVAGGGEVVKVLDFGIAKPLGAGEARLTVTGQIVGTPAYLSPEQATGAHVDVRSDLYALGVLAFRCLTGRLPYDVDDPSDVFFAIAQGQKRSLAQTAPTLAPELAAIVDRALSLDPRARFTSAREMRAALEPFLSGRMSLERTAPTMPIAAGAGASHATVAPREVPSTLHSAGLSPRRRGLGPTIAIGLGVGVLTAVGVAVALMSTGNGDGRPAGVAPPTPTAAIPVALPDPPMLPAALGSPPDAGPASATTETPIASARTGPDHAQHRVRPATGGCSDIYSGEREPPDAYYQPDLSSVVISARPALRQCFPDRTGRVGFWVAMELDERGSASRVRAQGLSASEAACVARGFRERAELPPRRDGQAGLFRMELFASPCE